MEDMFTRGLDLEFDLDIVHSAYIPFSTRVFVVTPTEIIIGKIFYKDDYFPVCCIALIAIDEIDFI